MTECQVQNGRATVRFECEDLARKAIQSFDGGLVESVKEKMRDFPGLSGGPEGENWDGNELGIPSMSG